MQKKDLHKKQRGVMASLWYFNTVIMGHYLLSGNIYCTFLTESVHV